MLKRILTAIAVVALGLTLGAAPAQAAPLHGCADNAICLYQWTNYGASKWQSSFYNLTIQPGNCINLTSPAAYWASDGAMVWDNSASMVVNSTGSYNSNMYVTVYDWANCNSNGSFNNYSAHIDTAEPNLANNQWHFSLNMYHRVTSIKISDNAG